MGFIQIENMILKQSPDFSSKKICGTLELKQRQLFRRLQNFFKFIFFKLMITVKYYWYNC